jgi:AAA15 family ATPase/GTPase
MNYWLVRAKWGVENKKAEFINNDEWINGYADKYLEIVKRVETEDILLLADDSRVTHYGKCVANPEDGRHLIVDKWNPFLLNSEIGIPLQVIGDKPIIQVGDYYDNYISGVILNAIEVTTIIQNTKITDIEIENFMVFKKENLYFSDGLNVVVGENGLGKTNLLKLLYALMNACVSYIQSNSSTEQLRFVNFIQQSLKKYFKTGSLSNLISWNTKESHIIFNLNQYHINFSINGDGKVTEDNNNSYPFVKKYVFIPAKEIISFYEGFISLYENRETSFDEIYYSLAKALSLPLLKNIDSYPIEYKVLLKLEEILEGKIVLENGKFFLLQNNRKTEISLIAEGFRKIGMIAQLLANGSLTKNSILFWDEPETNLNPRLIRKMAEVLVELSRAGMQIFIATHSLFLVKEIEILRNKQDKVKYFGLGLNEDKEVRVSQSEDFEYLEDIVILDEEFDQDSRFLAKEEG